MGILDILLGGGAARGGGRGGSASGGGNMTKVGMALIAYMLWRWYQNSRAGGGAGPSPMPAPSPRGDARIPHDEPSARFPNSDPMPAPRSESPDDSDFGPLIESTRNMPEAPRGGRRGRPMDDEQMDEGGMEGGMGGGGSLGDILNDILTGGRGMPGGDPRGGPGGGFPRGEPGGGSSRGGRGGGLEDILGDILGGGRGMPGSRFSGSGAQSDPLSALLQGAGIGGIGGLLAGGAGGGMLGDLMRQFDQSGAGDAAKSWVSTGENMPVTPKQIETTFGPDIINQLADQFGLDKTELLQGLSETLPDVVNQLTPDGRLPSEDEISRWK